LFRIHEYYGWTGRANEGLRLTATEIARRIKEKEGWLKSQNWARNIHRVVPGPADTSIFDVQNDNCIATDMEKEGIFWLKADKKPGSRVNGWAILRSRLEACLSHPMERPGLFIFEHCRHFLRTVPVLPRSENNPDDVDTNAEDHVADEVRYRLLQAKSFFDNCDLS
jgi:hypothetical protein